MNFKRIFTLAGLVAGGALTIAANPAHAAGFDFSSVNTTSFGSHSFSFSNTVSGTPSGNQMLQGVSFGGYNYSTSGLLLTTGVSIIHNDAYTGGNTGAASADMGVGATIGVSAEDPTAANITAALANYNMNSIVDTEDSGRFVMEVAFSQAARNFLLWERGQNSKMLIEALNDAGGVIGRFLLDSSKAASAGFNINTREIGYNQAVGSTGVNFEQSTRRLRLISTGAAFNGADFKVMAAVPEPMTMTGTALAAGAFFAARRKKRKQAAEA